MLRILITGFLALVLPSAAIAVGVIESSKGDVQVGAAPSSQGRRVLPPSTITTAPGAQAFLKFDDGTQIVLGENSLLRFLDYRYTPGAGESDRAVFELLRGSARVVTGRIAASNPKEFFFRTPQTELTVPHGGADFTVALVNPAYVTVHVGKVTSSNGSGPAILNAGSTSVVVSNATAPSAASASSIPPSASAAMKNLSVASVTSPAGGGAAGAAVVGGAAQEVSQWVIIGIVIAGAVALIAGNTDSDNQTVTTTTHH